jgi:hypothetical protein
MKMLFFNRKKIPPQITTSIIKYPHLGNAKEEYKGGF